MSPALFKKAFEDLARNGVWGTCSECTWEDPAKCVFADRYDHKLTAAQLYESALIRIDQATKSVRRGPEKGSGWHKDDGFCWWCGASQGEECRSPCYPGAIELHRKS